MNVLHLDDHLIVVSKPPGLLAQPDHTDAPSVLRRVEALLAARTDVPDPFVGLVHRLDRPTSGLMVLARTTEAARVLSAQFRERTVSKTYLALVEGRLTGLGTWTDYVAKLDQTPQLVAPDHPRGKRARLEWQAVGPPGEHTLLRVQLRTGRPHQIRLQAQSRGHPVVGDTRYGGEQAGAPAAIGLHHAVLRVDPPDAPRRRTFAAPPPNKWRSWMSGAQRGALQHMLDQARPPSANASPRS